MKYKVGDKVILRDELKLNRAYDGWWLEGVMLDFAKGKTLTVYQIKDTGDYYYTLKDETGITCSYFTDAMLKPAVEPLRVEPFKIKVNAEQSKIVQERLFGLGYTWLNGSTNIEGYITHTPWLVFGFRQDKLGRAYGYDGIIRHIPEITFEEFKAKYMETTELKITKEKVLEAASKCSTAENVLKTLFPEVFKPASPYFDLGQLKPGGNYPQIFTSQSSAEAGFNNEYFIGIRNGGKYHNKGFYLDSTVNWQIVLDNNGIEILVPTKKQ